MTVTNYNKLPIELKEIICEYAAEDNKTIAVIAQISKPHTEIVYTKFFPRILSNYKNFQEIGTVNVFHMAELCSSDLKILDLTYRTFNLEQILKLKNYQKLEKLIVSGYHPEMFNFVCKQFSILSSIVCEGKSVFKYQTTSEEENNIKKPFSNEDTETLSKEKIEDTSISKNFPELKELIYKGFLTDDYHFPVSGYIGRLLYFKSPIESKTCKIQTEDFVQTYEKENFQVESKSISFSSYEDFESKMKTEKGSKIENVYFAPNFEVPISLAKSLCTVDRFNLRRLFLDDDYVNTFPFLKEFFKNLKNSTKPINIESLKFSFKETPQDNEWREIFDENICKNIKFLTITHCKELDDDELDLINFYFPNLTNLTMIGLLFNEEIFDILKEKKDFLPKLERFSFIKVQEWVNFNDLQEIVGNIDENKHNNEQMKETRESEKKIIALSKSRPSLFLNISLSSNYSQDLLFSCSGNFQDIKSIFKKRKNEFESSIQKNKIHIKKEDSESEEELNVEEDDYSDIGDE
jgi:hypothetical protein